MNNLPYWGFLNRPILWNEQEAEKQNIHNLIMYGEDIIESLKLKHRIYERKDNLKTLHKQYLFNPKYYYMQRLRCKGLDKTLRPYWLWLCEKLNYECQLCHKKLPLEDLHVDHVMPLSRNGKHVWHNIQPLCRSCNSKKGDSIFISSAVEQTQIKWEEKHERATETML